MPIGRARTAALVLLVASAATCAERLAPVVVRYPNPRIRPAVIIDGIFTADTAVASLMAVFTRLLGVPPFAVDVHFYPGNRAFETALVGTGSTPALARASAERLIAIGGHRRVLVNDARFDELEWPSRVQLLAHELVHALQYELTGGRRGTSEQWLREGFAEWMAIRAIDELGGIDRRAALARLEQVWRASRGAVPRFDEMMTFPQWVDVVARPGVEPVALATLAVDVLIERHGVSAVVDYFRLFATREEPAANFQQAFGDTRESFETSWRP